MNIPIEQVLVIVALLLLGGVLASKISDRFGVPALLLFLALGMLADDAEFEPVAARLTTVKTGTPDPGAESGPQ